MRSVPNGRFRSQWQFHPATSAGQLVKYAVGVFRVVDRASVRMGDERVTAKRVVGQLPAHTENKGRIARNVGQLSAHTENESGSARNAVGQLSAHTENIRDGARIVSKTIAVGHHSANTGMTKGGARNAVFTLSSENKTSSQWHRGAANVSNSLRGKAVW